MDCNYYYYQRNCPSLGKYTASFIERNMFKYANIIIKGTYTKPYKSLIMIVTIGLKVK